MSIEGGPITQPPPRQFPQGTPPPAPAPQPQPEPTPSGAVIYDSHIHSKLHDGKVRTVTQEGSIAPGGLGAECRASGNPKIQVNADGTFSLVTGSGEVETLSLRLRSRHNEPDPCDNRFGGYGFAVKRTEYDAKRETCHNNHDQATAGSIPTLTNGTYFKIEFTINDESGKVRWVAKVNGTQVMSKLTDRQVADPALFNQQSYIWLRGNNSDFGRIYVYVKNYNAKLEVEAKFDSGNSVTFKSVRVIAI